MPLGRNDAMSEGSSNSPRTRMDRWRAATRLVHQLVRIHPRPFIIAVSGAAVFALCTVASSVVLRWVIDNVIDPAFRQGGVEKSTVVAGLSMVLMVGVVRAAGVIVRRRWAGMARFQIAETLTGQVVDRLVQQPVSWHQKRQSGDLAARAGVDVDASVEMLSPLPFACGVVLLVFVSSIWMISIDVPLGLFAVAVFPLLITINMSYQHRVDRHFTEAQDHLGDLSAAVHESFEGVQVVKAFGAEDRETERLSVIADRLRNSRTSAVLLRGTFDAILDVVPSLVNVLLVLFGALRIRAGELTIGDLSSMIYMFTLLVFPLRIIGYALSALPHALAGWTRIREVLDEPIERDPALDLHTAAPGVGVSFDHASYEFEPDRPVLTDVDVRVTVGTTVALVGTTGSGKTTLLRLADGLLPTTSGSVSAAAGDRAIVLQEAFLLGDTLRENIAFGGTYTDDEIWTALDCAEGRDFVADLPRQLDTEVGERGVSLSGGQRQRVALARALVRRPSVLLLDDTTSALDPATEARVVANLRSELDRATVLMIASRPSTIALADQVVFLHEGRVVASGTHASLLRSDEMYRSIMEAFEHDRGTVAQGID